MHINFDFESINTLRMQMKRQCLHSEMFFVFERWQEAQNC